MQRWWNLSKLVTNTLVKFGNFFNCIIRSHPLSAQEKVSSENFIGRNAQFPSVWGIVIKTWRRILLEGMSKIEQIQFFDSPMYLFETINLKLFDNHGEIYRFRRKFNKDSGEIKPLGVYRNMIIGKWQYVCLLFCWSWPKGWDNFQKREDSRKWGIDFEIVDIDTSAHWY